MSKRDFVMARLCVAQATAKDLSYDIHNVIEMFIDPEDDRDGSERDAVLHGCELGCHSLLQAIQLAAEALQTMSDEELSEQEDDDDDEDDADAGDKEAAA